MYRTSLVGSLYPVVSLLEVGTIARLVAQAPYDDRWMVLERHDITLVALQVHLLKIRALGQCALSVAHAVTLQVGLGSQIDTILVAEVVPTGIVRVVAGAHGIDVQLLHNLDVLDHALYRDDITAIRVQLMTVGTFY